MSQAHRLKQNIKNLTHLKTKIILIQFFKTCLLVKTTFYLFQMPVFSHSSILEFGGGHTIKQLTRESPDLSACPWLLRLKI